MLCYKQFEEADLVENKAFIWEEGDWGWVSLALSQVCHGTCHDTVVPAQFQAQDSMGAGRWVSF